MQRDETHVWVIERRYRDSGWEVSGHFTRTKSEALAVVRDMERQRPEIRWQATKYAAVRQ